MESKSASIAKREVTWSQKLSDFSIILEDGEKIRVHKHVMAENSEVFETMLTQEFQETQNSEMVLEHFDRGTVVSFVEYLYAGVVNDHKTIEEIKVGVGPDKYIYKRSFERRKFTIDLLRMADMFQVKDLKADCSQYLKKNITDENVIDIWLGAETLEDESLSSTAIEHLVERPRGTHFKDLPGFSEAFQSSNKPLKKLVDILSDKNHHLKEEILNLKEKVSSLESRIIKIVVKRRMSTDKDEWTEVFDIKSTETISTLLQEVKKRKKRKNGEWCVLSKNNSAPFCDLHINSTFLQENIATDTILYVW